MAAKSRRARSADNKNLPGAVAEMKAIGESSSELHVTCVAGDG